MEASRSFTAGVKFVVTVNGDQPSYKLRTHIQVICIHVQQVGDFTALVVGNRPYDALIADKRDIFFTYTPKQTQTNIHSSITADQQMGWRRCSALLRRADRSREWPAVRGESE